MRLHIVGFWKTRDIWINGEKLLPDESQKVVNHSPDGFNWGYGGSGPAQLALAILLKFYPKEIALNQYQYFKWATVAQWPQSDIDLEIEFNEILASA